MHIYHFEGILNIPSKETDDCPYPTRKNGAQNILEYLQFPLHQHRINIGDNYQNFRCPDIFVFVMAFAVFEKSDFTVYQSRGGANHLYEAVHPLKEEG